MNAHTYPCNNKTSLTELKNYFNEFNIQYKVIKKYVVYDVVWPRFLPN